MRGYVKKPIRVYLLDDHDIVRRGLHDLLAAKRDITVVGESGSAHAAVKRIIDLKPDVMVLDLQLQDGLGIHVCRNVRAFTPTVQALLLTSAGDDEALISAVLAGAAGYMTKLVGSLDIVASVRRIGAGEFLMSEVATRIAKERLVDEGLVGRQTESDREILMHVLAGRTNSEIAAAMGVSLEEANRAVTALVDSVITSYRA
jgi:two-component system response regulator DevR